MPSYGPEQLHGSLLSGIQGQMMGSIFSLFGGMRKRNFYDYFARLSMQAAKRNAEELKSSYKMAEGHLKRSSDMRVASTEAGYAGAGLAFEGSAASVVNEQVWQSQIKLAELRREGRSRVANELFQGQMQSNLARYKGNLAMSESISGAIGGLIGIGGSIDQANNMMNYYFPGAGGFQMTSLLGGTVDQGPEALEYGGYVD